MTRSPSHLLPVTPDLRAQDLFARAHPDLVELLEMVRRVARAGRMGVWAVGGVVRDLLLGIESRDLDLVVLRSAESFSATLANDCGASPPSASGFLSLAFTSANGFRVDVVRARAESYPDVAALPEVRPGTLLEDLRRRDFSVNAIAASIDDAERPVVDPFDGGEDLVQSRLRVLHEHSFSDDPTRIFRGLRLGDRLDFEFELGTAALAKREVAHGVLDRLSGPRLRNELRLLLGDLRSAPRLVDRCAEIGLEKTPGGRLEWSGDAARRLAAVVGVAHPEAAAQPFWLGGLVALLWEHDVKERRHFAGYLQLERGHRRILEAVPDLVRAAEESFSGLNSAHARFLLGKDLGDFGRWIAERLGSEGLATFLRDEWSDLARRRLSISGEDLKEHGFEAGPAIGAALDRTLEARLEGRIQAAEELDFAISSLRSHQGTADGQRGDAGDGDDSEL